jgi:hypothetical protein
MKKIEKTLILTFAVSLFAVTNSDAQVYLKVPPPASKTINKAARTSKYEVWVPEDWVLSEYNKKYLYRPGFWAFPPTPKSVYIPGYWQKTPKGYTRMPGYWKNPHY